MNRDERQLPHRKRTLDMFLEDIVDTDVDIDGSDDESHVVDVAPTSTGMATEGNEDVEDDEEDEEYALRFEGDMDPLAFADVDQSGNLPYQQFERMEYAALAERKRKALAKKREEAELENQQNICGANIDDVWAAFGPKRRRRGKDKEARKRGRKKLAGASRLPSEVSKKLGEANLLYATSKFDEAINLLKEVVRLAPNVPDAYHTLGLVYDALGDRKKALNFYMICAHLKPKDAVLWKRLASWSTEMGNTGQAIHCLTKAIRADPDDIEAKWYRASLYEEVQDYQKAAEAFEQMLQLRPSDIDVCKKVAETQHKNGYIGRATEVLDKFLNEHPSEADLTAVNLLAELHMENGSYLEALSQIDRARATFCSGQGLTLDLAIKAGVCHVHLGNGELAESYFEELWKEGAEYFDFVLYVGDTYLNVAQHHNALRYYTILEGNGAYDNASLSLKVAQSYLAIDSIKDAIRVYYKVIEKMPQHVDARLTLAELLLNSGKQDDACMLLKPPQISDTSVSGTNWWQNGKVKMKLAEIYHSQSKFYLFLETILPAIQESLYVESFNQKVKGRKRLSKSVLSERVKILEEDHVDEVFPRFGPQKLSRNERAKASRARKALAKRAAEKEEKKAETLAAGLEWESEDESDEEERETELKQSPLPNLLKDDKHYQTLLQTCEALARIQRYWEAIEIVHHSLRVGSTTLSNEQQDELRELGAHLAYKTRDARYGYDCARYMVQQRPYSLSTWNCYYQVVSRSETKVPRHNKFMLQMRNKFPDCVPAMMVIGHQFAMINQSQGALREYLHAYKQQPEDPFINLCVGINFINLSQGFRLSNRNQCVLQGFAFLYKYQRLSNHNQESNYNIARAYHCVGLGHVAVSYYEKVLEQCQEDRPIVRLPYETSSQDDVQSSGHCDLRREAAYNLHLIYKKSGAIDLARQLLRDYCTIL